MILLRTNRNSPLDHPLMDDFVMSSSNALSTQPIIHNTPAGLFDADLTYSLDSWTNGLIILKRYRGALVEGCCDYILDLSLELKQFTDKVEDCTPQQWIGAVAAALKAAITYLRRKKENPGAAIERMLYTIPHYLRAACIYQQARSERS